MMQRNLSTELQATRGQLQRSEEENMRRNEILLAAIDRNERSIAEAHKDINKVMNAADVPGKDIKVQRARDPPQRENAGHAAPDPNGCSCFELLEVGPYTKGPQLRR